MTARAEQVSRDKQVTSTAHGTRAEITSRLLLPPNKTHRADVGAFIRTIPSEGGGKGDFEEAFAGSFGSFGVQRGWTVSSIVALNEVTEKNLPR